MSIFDLFDWAKNLIATLGYAGVFLGTFLESVFPPIPSEVIMGFSGFLISEGRFNWPGVILAAVAGNVASVSLIWWIGKHYGRDFLIKWGKYIGITASEIEKGERLFTRFGYAVVLICQVIPLARSWIAFPAGVLKTTYPKFIIFNTLGASIWLTVLCYLGYQAGENWTEIENFIKPFERVILGVLVLLILLWAGKLIYSKLQSKNEKNV
ncbi:MAG: DedA family protein [Patescibacteria group bacterium]